MGICALILFAFTAEVQGSDAQCVWANLRILASRSMQSTVDRATREKPIEVDSKDLWNWGPDKYEQRGDALTQVLGAADLPQEMLSLEKYSKDEQSLIRQLIRLAKSRDYKREYYKKVYPEVEGKAFKFYQEELRQGLKTTQDVKELASDLSKPVGGVEVGAWRVTLRSGKVVTALHTSYLDLSISGEALSKALNELHKSHDFSAEDILVIQYFHTHPYPNGLPTLSKDDSDIFFSIKGQMTQFAGRSVPFHMYSISAQLKWIFTFHLGSD